MQTIRLTMAQALIRFLCAQRTELDGVEQPLFAGCFGIFGHGNVTCLAEALHAAGDALPTWRGQNEQAMALAAIGFAKARRRRQMMVCAASIGPGALNMVTAAGVAHANRLPVLLLAGDTFASRLPDPVLQQIEQFHDPSLTANDAFRPVSRYWDRLQRPEQLLQSLPQAVGVLLDPGDCGPAFLALAQDAQGEAFDYPVAFFAPRLHRIRRARADLADLADAAQAIRAARAPLIIAGGGVRYSGAEAELAGFAQRHGIPVAETIAGRGTLTHDHPANAGPIGVIGSTSANALAAEADLVLAIGTRLQDFVTGSWSVFGNPAMRLVTLNTARFDAAKHLALGVVGDARESLLELDAALADWRAPAGWNAQARQAYAAWNATIDARIAPSDAPVPSYAQVVGAVNRAAADNDLVITAAGGLPGELTKVWRVKSPGTFDCEFGFSCMGYEIAGAWGAKMARPDDDVFVLTGDGSYLMLNADIYSSVLTGHKLIVVVCDNGGFAVINRLQQAKGGAAFNNLLADCRIQRERRVDFVAHARAMGALAERAGSIAALQAALARAKSAETTSVIVLDTDAFEWTSGDAWWEVGMPEVSTRPAVAAAARDLAAGRARRRLGV